MQVDLVKGPSLLSIYIALILQDEHDCVPEQVHGQHHQGKLQPIHIHDRCQNYLIIVQ
jgi:hypothetical protein